MKEPLGLYISHSTDLISRGAAIDAVYERIKQIGYENDASILSIRQAVIDVPSAIPLSPHGPLIDAKALKEHIDGDLGRVFVGVTVGEALKILVDEMPVIVEETP